MRWLAGFALIVASCAAAHADSEPGLPVKYVGGTLNGCTLNSRARLYLTGSDTLLFRCNAGEVNVAYNKLTALRYSQTAHRRWAETAATAPLWPIAPFVFVNRSRKHFVTVEYAGADGGRQGFIMLVAKDNIRRLLADLKARAGRPIEYEDEDPRRSRKDKKD